MASGIFGRNLTAQAPNGSTSSVTSTSPTSKPSTSPAGYFGTQRTQRQGGYKPIGSDQRITAGGDFGTIRNRVESTFGNRGVGLNVGATEGESEAQRLDRIAREIISGDSTFGSVRQSVDRLADNADHTRASAGLDPVTQPQLTPEELGALIDARWRADAAFKGTEADVAEQEARLGFDVDMQRDQMWQRYEDMRDQGMRQAAARGMAFQPYGAGREQRDIGLREGRQSEELEARYGFATDELAERLAAARRARDLELGSIEDREQAMRSARIREELAQFA